MPKYLQVIKNTFQDYLVYRLNFILWRFRSFVLFLTLVFFWQAVFGQKESLLGYSREGMLTYVVGITFLRQVVLGSRTADFGGTIRSGDLTNLLLRPISVAKFWFSKDLVDKFLNIIFTTLEIGVVVYLLKIPIYLPQQLITYLWFGIICVIAMFLYFYFSFLFGTIAFWTDQIWAPRWLFMVIFLEFLSGGFFPLDVLPPIFVKVLSFTPFPYMIYFPMKIWLEQVVMLEILRVLTVTIFWTLLTYLAFDRVWKKGIRSYEAYGR